MAGLSDLFTALNNIAANLGRLVAQTALSVVVPISQGGTGATTAAGARANLGVAASGAVTGSGLTMATGDLLGRTTAGTGAVEQITLSNDFSFAADNLALAAPQGTVSFQTPGTGSTLTASSGQGTYELAPSGTIATLTVVLPPTPADGQLFEITTTQAITALTVSAPGGASVSGGSVLLSANGGISFRYRTADTTWRRRW